MSLVRMSAKTRHMSDRPGAFYALRVRRISPRSDDLTEVLRAINIRSTVFCRSEFSAPWGFRVDDSTIAKFHLVLMGEACLELEGQAESYRLTMGDIVLLPHGTAHVMKDRPISGVRDLDRILRDNPVDWRGRMSYGGRGRTTTIVCGAFDTAPLPEDVLEVLPRVLVLGSGEIAATRWLEPMAGLLAAEEPANAGEAAVLAKVADVFLTEFLRQYLARHETMRVHLPPASVADAPVAQSLRLMRRDPRFGWTVERLARGVGMSRTAFAARFREVVGEPPMTYLTKLRLSNAAGYLSTTTRTLGDIARNVGYDNEASFSKAFKRTYGRAPSAFRAEWSA
jgi:AraC-like DNA-binding protein